MGFNRKNLRITLLLVLLSLVLWQTSHAGSATWSANPRSHNWNTSTNWTPAAVPNSPADIATFATSTQTYISLSNSAEANQLSFIPGASSYSIVVPAAVTLLVSGAGISNNSGTTQNFVTQLNSTADFGIIRFQNSANAGSNVIYTALGGALDFFIGGFITLNGNSSAGSATFVAEGGNSNGPGPGEVGFGSNSTAANATFINKGGTAHGAYGGLTYFFSGTAANAVFYNDGGKVSGAQGGATYFEYTSTAGNAHLIAYDGVSGASGGVVSFYEDATGGTARIEVYGGGLLNIGIHNLPGVTIGSLEGDGAVQVGLRNLIIGANNLSTNFSGFFYDYNGGGVTKIGSGLFTLGNGISANYIADTISLAIANDAVINLNFTGVPERVRSLIIGGTSQIPGLYGSNTSGAPHQISQFAGAGKVEVMMRAISRKMQGANTFDIDLPLVGPPGSECRSGGASNEHQIVVTFLRPVTFDRASVTSPGNGEVAGVSGNGTATITLNLTGIVNAQILRVTLFQVNDGTMQSDITIPMIILLGDVTGDGRVNASDVSQTKTNSGQMLNASNFRNDVTANSVINGSDVSLVKLKSGTGLSPTSSQTRGAAFSKNE